MTISDLRNRGYALFLQTRRYEIIVYLGCMDVLQLTGLITWLLKLQS